MTMKINKYSFVVVESTAEEPKRISNHEKFEKNLAQITSLFKKIDIKIEYIENITAFWETKKITELNVNHTGIILFGRKEDNDRIATVEQLRNKNYKGLILLPYVLDDEDEIETTIESKVKRNARFSIFKTPLLYAIFETKNSKGQYSLDSMSRKQIEKLILLDRPLQLSEEQLQDAKRLCDRHRKISSFFHQYKKESSSVLIDFLPSCCDEKEKESIERILLSKVSATTTVEDFLNQPYDNTKTMEAEIKTILKFPLPNQNYSILFVDDEEGARKEMEMTIVKLGIKNFKAKDTVQAGIDYLESEEGKNIDVVITDWQFYDENDNNELSYKLSLLQGRDLVRYCQKRNKPIFIYSKTSWDLNQQYPTSRNTRWYSKMDITGEKLIQNLYFNIENVLQGLMDFNSWTSPTSHSKEPYYVLYKAYLSSPQYEAWEKKVNNEVVKIYDSFFKYKMNWNIPPISEKLLDEDENKNLKKFLHKLIWRRSILYALTINPELGLLEISLMNLYKEKPLYGALILKIDDIKKPEFIEKLKGVYDIFNSRTNLGSKDKEILGRISNVLSIYNDQNIDNCMRLIGNITRSEDKAINEVKALDDFSSILNTHLCLSVDKKANKIIMPDTLNLLDEEKNFLASIRKMERVNK